LHHHRLKCFAPRRLCSLATQSVPKSQNGNRHAAGCDPCTAGCRTRNDCHGARPGMTIGNGARLVGLLILCLAANAASADDQQAMLSTHNAARSKHCAPALKWSAQIAASAQAWANGCTFSHQANSGYGENLFWGTAGAYSPQVAVANWYGEVAAYDFAAPGFGQKTGHFTQIVWRNSKELGCAKASCPGRDYWVCRYSPPGNVAGQFPENVSQASCGSDIGIVPKPRSGFDPVKPAPPASSIEIVPLPRGDPSKLFRMKP